MKPVQPRRRRACWRLALAGALSWAGVLGAGAVGASQAVSAAQVHQSAALGNTAPAPSVPHSVLAARYVRIMNVLVDAGQAAQSKLLKAISELSSDPLAAMVGIEKAAFPLAHAYDLVANALAKLDAPPHLKSLILNQVRTERSLVAVIRQISHLSPSNVLHWQEEMLQASHATQEATTMVERALGLPVV